MTFQALRTDSAVLTQQTFMGDNSFTLRGLPPELIPLIFANLNVSDIPRVSLVCRQWREFSRDDDLLKALLARNFPHCNLSAIQNLPKACQSRHILYSQPGQAVYPSQILNNNGKECRLNNTALHYSCGKLLSKNTGANTGEITFKVYDLETGDLINDFDFFLGASVCHFDLKSMKLYVGRPTGDIQIWDVKGNDCHFETDLLKGCNVPITSTAFVMGKIYFGSGDGTIKILDIGGESPSLIGTVERGHAKPITHLIYTDAKLYSCSREEGTIKVWDFNRDGEIILVKTLEGFTHQLGQKNCLFAKGKLFSPNHEERKITAYDLEKGNVAMIFEGHNEKITSLISAEGLLIGASWDGILTVWDIQTGDCLRTLQGPVPIQDRDPAEGHFHICSLAYAESGNLCTGYSKHGTVGVWDLNAINTVAPEPAPIKSARKRHCILC